MADLQIPETEHYREAIDSVRKRVPVRRDVWDQMQAEEREHAFTVSRVARMDVLQDVLDSIDKAVETGTAITDFRAEVADKLIEQWGGSEIPGRINTIFRTNIQVAYAEGRHAINNAPAVREARPYLRFDDTDNDRECDLCHECGGVVRPADDPWWETHSPPLHFNAVLARSLIATDRGMIPASELSLGDMVVTHNGRLRPITAVMRKLSQNKSVRILKTDTGGVIAITHEHPVLVDSPIDGLVWKSAGQIEVGDVLFQLDDEITRKESALVAHPENAPSLGNQPCVAEGVVSFPVSRPVVLSVYLDSDHPVRERYVNDVGADGVLRDCTKGSEQSEKVMLRWGQFLSVGHASSPCTCGSDGEAFGGVVEPHSFRNQGATLAPRPVISSGSLRDHIRSLIRQGNLLLSCSDGDPELATPVGQHPLGGSSFLLQIPNALFGLPVLAFDQGGEGLSGPRRFIHARIIAVEEKMYDGQLCDFEVAEDNSYVADSVIVHNCECQVTALSPEEAEEEGVTGARDMPDVEADEGFGNEPSSEGKDWAPDLEGYDPELREALEKMLARYEG